MKWRFVLVAVVFFVLTAVFTPGASAQGSTPLTLPSLDQLLKTSLSALGALVCTGLFGYYWGYAVSAIAARMSWNISS